MGLLDHRSAIVRIHALSLLIRAKSQKEPFRAEVLRRLQASLPYFHCEVDPKTRNDFIALAKRLILRVIAVISSQDQTVGRCVSCASNYGCPLMRHTPKPPIYCLPPDRTVDFPGKGSFECTIPKTGNTKKAQGMTATSFDEHVAFFKWYTSFLTLELQSTATYQRHITALEMLGHIVYKTPRVQSTRSPDPRPWLDETGITRCPSYTQALVRPLFDLVMNPFEDVRASAASCLFFVLESWPRAWTAKIDIARQVRTTEQLMRATGRADHADGFARIWRLHCQVGPLVFWPEGNSDALEQALVYLQTDIDMARSNLQSAVENSPLHGHIIALR